MKLKPLPDILPDAYWVRVDPVGSKPAQWHCVSWVDTSDPQRALRATLVEGAGPWWVAHTKHSQFKRAREDVETYGCGFIPQKAFPCFRAPPNSLNRWLNPTRGFRMGQMIHLSPCCIGAHAYASHYTEHGVVAQVTVVNEQGELWPQLGVPVGTRGSAPTVFCPPPPDPRWFRELRWVERTPVHRTHTRWEDGGERLVHPPSSVPVSWEQALCWWYLSEDHSFFWLCYRARPLQQWSVGCQFLARLVDVQAGGNRLPPTDHPDEPLIELIRFRWERPGTFDPHTWLRQTGYIPRTRIAAKWVFEACRVFGQPWPAWLTAPTQEMLL